jgi:hypothetical protein
VNWPAIKQFVKLTLMGAAIWLVVILVMTLLGGLTP